MTEKMLERMFEQYADTVYRVCYTYLGNAADCEDAVQEVFVRLMRKRPRFASERDERGWLIVTACNYCKSQLRWRKRHPVADADSLPEKRSEEDRHGELLELIMSLPEESRQVVFMHCCEGYSLAEIARLSGQNQSTVRSHMFRARQQLKELLGGIEDE